LVKDQLTQISTKAGRVAFIGVSNQIVGGVGLWLLKKAGWEFRRKDGERDY
jgi:hypothetical protein